MIKKILRKLSEILQNFFLFGIGRLIRKFKKRPLPKNPDGRRLIHIGCGLFNNPRFINVDVRPGWHIHFIDTLQDCARLFPFEYADLIYGCHVLEHIPYTDVKPTLQKLYRTLKPGGILRLSVPNFSVIVSMYQEKHALQDILPPLMGGQGYAANFHYGAFDERYLEKLLLESGFRAVRRWDPTTAADHPFNDWAGRYFPLYDKSWPISLNLEGIR